MQLGTTSHKQAKHKRKWRKIRMYCRQCGEELNNPKAVICVKCGTNRG